MTSNNSTDCPTFSENEVNTIFLVRVAVAVVSFIACSLGLCILSVMICCLRVWKTYVHRLKLYLVVVASILSIMYLLQALPMSDGAVETPDEAKNLEQKWNTGCKPIIFFLMYFNWMLLILICLMVVYLLWIVHQMGKPLSDFHFQYHRWPEVMMIIFTITLPLLIIWIPFVKDYYGLDGANIWCGFILERSGNCNKRKGLGYVVGIWYIPGLLVTFFCTAGIIVVVAYVWIYYRKKGYTEKMRRAIIQGVPPIIYLIVYDIISILNLMNLLTKSGIISGGDGLWITNAITGPCRALAIPIAFIFGTLSVRYCFKKKRTAYNSLR